MHRLSLARDLCVPPAGGWLRVRVVRCSNALPFSAGAGSRERLEARCECRLEQWPAVRARTAWRTQVTAEYDTIVYPSIGYNINRMRT